MIIDFNLDFYTDVMDLRRVVMHDATDGGEARDDGGWSTRHKALNEALCGLIDDFSLVGFETLDINNKESVLALVRVCDKAIGYIPHSSSSGGGGAERGVDGSSDRSSMAYAVALCGVEFAYERALAVQEKVYFDEKQETRQLFEESNKISSSSSTTSTTATETTTTTATTETQK